MHAYRVAEGKTSAKLTFATAPQRNSLFGAGRAQILGIPLVASALDRLLEHIAQPVPCRIFTIRGVLIPY